MVLPFVEENVSGLSANRGAKRVPALNEFRRDVLTSDIAELLDSFLLNFGRLLRIEQGEEERRTVLRRVEFEERQMDKPIFEGQRSVRDKLCGLLELVLLVLARVQFDGAGDVPSRATHGEVVGVHYGTGQFVEVFVCSKFFGIHSAVFESEKKTVD